MPSTLDLYEITIPVFIKGFTNIQAILEKAASHDASSLSTKLPTLKLVDDMLPFTFQIQTMSNVAKAVAPRLIGCENVSMEDDEKTLEDLQKRIAKTIEVLQAVPKEGWEKAEDADVSMPRGGLKFKGKQYVLDFAIPNFYFHETMAYALIRKEGVSIGKGDFLGKLD